MALRQRLVEHSGVTDADFDDVEDGVPRKWTCLPAWLRCRPSSICSSMSASLASAREVLGPEAVYLHHNDLHAGYSSPGWHRDNVHRTFGQGEDWDESTTPYRCARIALYLQTHAESGFKFGLIPGSHRRESRLVRWERRAPRFSTVRRMVMGKGWPSPVPVGSPQSPVMWSSLTTVCCIVEGERGVQSIRSTQGCRDSERSFQPPLVLLPRPPIRPALSERARGLARTPAV